MNRGLALILFLMGGGALAQDLSEAVFLAELPQVLTASRIAASPMDAPTPVTVIDRETLRASGFTEIHDVLRLVPGFLVADWPRGSPVVVNHGLGDAHPNRLLVLVDGISVVTPATGEVDWQDLPIRLEDVERIEVVRAPNQATYGAAAFQGVIHIFTREAGADAGAGALLALGRQGFRDLYARYGRSHGQLDWRLSASSRVATNFRDLARPGYEFREEIARQTLNLRLGYRPDARDEWIAQLGLGQGADQVGSRLNADTEPYRDRKQRQYDLRLTWQRSYAAGSQLALRYGRFQREKREASVLSAAGQSTPVHDDLDASRDQLEYQQVHAFSETLTGVWGLGARQDRARSQRLLYGLGTVEGSQWQLFAHLDWRFAPAWLLHAGLTLERHYDTDTLVSPRLALNWSVAPQQSLRLAAGQGYRAPSLAEANAREVVRYLGSVPALYGKIIDLGTWTAQVLEPERMRFVELGYVGHLPEAGLQVDARIFAERHDRYIDDRACTVNDDCPFPPPAGYQRPPFLGQDKADYFYNAGRIRTHGADLTLDWRHPDLGRILLTHAYTRIRAGAGTDSDTERTAPRHATSLLWSLPLPAGLQVNLGLYRVGYMEWLNDGDKQPAYTRVDVRLAKRLGPRHGEDEIALTLQNVNGRHTEFRTSSTVERQAFATLRLAW